MLPMIANGYVHRWAAAVDTERPPSPERLTRAIATHLLDSGHSSGSLHRWVFALTRNPDATIGDVLTGAAELATRADQAFEVLVPFTSVPDPDDSPSIYRNGSPPPAPRRGSWRRA